MKIVHANKIEFLMTRGNRKIIVLLHPQFLFFFPYASELQYSEHLLFSSDMRLGLKF